MMNKYERLLVELGEKSSVSVGSTWPVEARICGLALFNAVVFLVIRLFASYLGPGLGSVLQQIVNAFLTKGDASEHIKKATGNENGGDYDEGVPAPPVGNNGGGGGGNFDFSSLISGLGGMFGGGGGGNKGKAPRRPTFRE